MGKYEGFYLKTPNWRTNGQILWWRFPFFPASKYVLVKCDMNEKKEIGKSYIIQMKIALSSRH